jgi:hypothetical protein
MLTPQYSALGMFGRAICKESWHIGDRVRLHAFIRYTAFGDSRSVTLQGPGQLQNFVFATPPQPSGARTQRTQGTKRKELDSSREQCDRPEKQLSTVGLPQGDSTANVVPPTTPNGTETDVLDMSPQELDAYSGSDMWGLILM